MSAHHKSQTSSPLSLLTQLRLEAGLSQTDVGKRYFKVGRQTIGRWERGEERPTPAHKVAFICYLGEGLGLYRNRSRFNEVWREIEAHWGWLCVNDDEWTDLADYIKQQPDVPEEPSPEYLSNNETLPELGNNLKVISRKIHLDKRVFLTVMLATFLILTTVVILRSSNIMAISASSNIMPGQVTYKSTDSKLGQKLGELVKSPNNTGFIQNYEDGYIYIFPDGKIIAIYGIPFHKLASLPESQRLNVGNPTTEQRQLADGGGIQYFDNAAIVWASPMDKDIFLVYDAYKRWHLTGDLSGKLGAPRGEQGITPDGVGHFQEFVGGSIYWIGPTQMWTVYEPILRKWGELGYEKRSSEYPNGLGYPEDEEKTTVERDSTYRVQKFNFGSIYVDVKGNVRVEYKEVNSIQNDVI